MTPCHCYCAPGSEASRTFPHTLGTPGCLGCVTPIPPLGGLTPADHVAALRAVFEAARKAKDEADRVSYRAGTVLNRAELALLKAEDRASNAPRIAWLEALVSGDCARISRTLAVMRAREEIARAAVEGTP